MRTLLFAVAVAMFLPFVVLAREEEPNNDFVVHGTVNIALGNKNGLVLLTDSMLTSSGHQLTEPGQKLFKLDDNTVCSVAGFISASTPIDDLNSSTSDIIYQYIRESLAQPPQTIAEKLRALASLLTFNLDAISNVRDATGHPTSIDEYRLQLIVAGYDLDRRQKIGRITLRTSKEHGDLVSFVDEASISIVEEKFIWKLNGIPDVATELLQHPESAPEDVALTQYAAALHDNGGSSLTVQQLVELAKRLAFHTSKAYPDVGGPHQIAIVTAPHKIKIEQQAFPAPTSSPFLFNLFVDGKFTGNALSFAPGLHALFVRCSWTGARQELDGHLFIGSTFTNSVLTYNGGRVILGDSNRVVSSILLVGPLLRPDDKTVQSLSRTFAWSRILRDFSSGPTNF
jgi:20S proteasome alpha/beta subunit